jgi:hypothetical protein
MALMNMMKKMRCRAMATSDDGASRGPNIVESKTRLGLGVTAGEPGFFFKDIFAFPGFEHLPREPFSADQPRDLGHFKEQLWT